MYLMERMVRECIWFRVLSPKYSEAHYHYENDTFEIIPYSYDEVQEYNFYHKPSGFKMKWYKYPLRDPKCNMHISHEEFFDMLEDCMNSTPERCNGPIKVVFDIKKWWKKENHGKPIYTVMTFNIKDEMLADARVVGFFSSYDEANEVVLNNIGDIKECTYDYALIEKVHPGLYPVSESVWFYKSYQEGYTQINRPECFKHAASFTIG